jgi:hypothetical protein
MWTSSPNPWIGDPMFANGTGPRVTEADLTKELIGSKTG